VPDQVIPGVAFIDLECPRWHRGRWLRKRYAREQVGAWRCRVTEWAEKSPMRDGRHPAYQASFATDANPTFERQLRLR
jgi:hypothetical protein